MMWLRAAFAAMLVTRAFCLCYYPPSEHLFSDPLRHLENAQQFFNYRLFGAIDPWLYQAWLWLFVPEEKALALSAMLLTLAFPVTWLFALKEIAPPRLAYIAAIVIGLHPSLMMIYGYYMNETLLLVLMALGFWLTFRAERRRSPLAFILASAVWAAATAARAIALPVALLCLGMLLWRERRHWPVKLIAAVALFALMFTPNCLRSQSVLGFCAPLGVDKVAKIYRAAGAEKMNFTVVGHGEHWVISPSHSQHPFAPLSDYQPLPKHAEFAFTIDSLNKESDWNQALARAHNLPKDHMRDFLINAIFLFFGESWPDNNPDYLLARASYHLRWLWLPLTLGAAVLALRTRQHIPLSALLLMTLLLLQTSAPMEGRYRKPAEPLLLASAVLLWPRRKEAL